MRKRLFNNWGLKLASLLLAVVVWLLVVQIEDPTDTKTFNNITVKFTGEEAFEKTNQVYKVLDKTDKVSVTVRAPKSVISQMRASDIVAEANLEKISDDNTVLIEYEVQNVGRIESIEGNRDSVRLSIEDKSSKWIKIVQNVVGEVAENYIVASSSAEVNIVEVSGPKSLIDTISYASAEMDVTGYSNSITANVDIQLYDYDGNVVESESIKKSENYIRMKVDVLAVKEVPLEINYMGIPAEGYMVTGVVLSEPDTIKIAGTPYALSGISNISVPEERLDITGNSSSRVEAIDIRSYLPTGIILADEEFNGMVKTTIQIEPVMEKTINIPVENIKIQNLPEGFEWQTDVEQYSIDIYGLAESVRSLRATDVHGQVDIAAWMEEKGIAELKAGKYRIPIEFDLNEGVYVEEITMLITLSESE